ncbi:MAG: hypothetical protein HYV68_02750 [Candidatus Taylorbacteria bacterium]|nr:hypothetical protein [Candidatus Taylorbacteria bacterium]
MMEQDAPFDFDTLRKAVDDPKLAEEAVRRESEAAMEEASRKQNIEEEKLRRELAQGGIEIEFSAGSRPEHSGAPKNTGRSGRDGFDYGKVQSELDERGNKFEGQLGPDSTQNDRIRNSPRSAS